MSESKKATNEEVLPWLADERNQVERIVAEYSTRLNHYYHGDHWFQLSDEEAAVFGLQLADMPRLVATYLLYASATYTMCDSDVSDERVEGLRSDLPWLAYKKPNSSEFRRFATLFDIKPVKAYAFFVKVEFSLARLGYDISPDQEAGI